MTRSFTDRSVRSFAYVTHSLTDTARHGLFAVGRASVDQVLKVDVMDVGCASGFGASFTVRPRGCGVGVSMRL
jgi:hypothetical protein